MTRDFLAPELRVLFVSDLLRMSRSSNLETDFGARQEQ
jgi:hypothetical protein